MSFVPELLYHPMDVSALEDSPAGIPFRATIVARKASENVLRASAEPVLEPWIGKLSMGRLSHADIIRENFSVPIAYSLLWASQPQQLEPSCRLCLSSQASSRRYETSAPARPGSSAVIVEPFHTHIGRHLDQSGKVTRRTPCVEVRYSGR